MKSTETSLLATRGCTSWHSQWTWIPWPCTHTSELEILNISCHSDRQTASY